MARGERRRRAACAAAVVCVLAAASDGHAQGDAWWLGYTRAGMRTDYDNGFCWKGKGVREMFSLGLERRLWAAGPAHLGRA